MEVRLREARAKHHEKHEQLRSQIGQESKKEFAVSMDRAGNQLEELMDKVDECEKEMIRMNQEHNKEVSSLRQVIERLQERLRSEETKDKENDVCKTAEKKRTPMKKGRGEKPKEESEDEESEGENHNEAGDEAEDNASIEPIKFTQSVGKKKTTRRNLRPRRALRNTNNKA
jgi:hypothetical protein